MCFLNLLIELKSVYLPRQARDKRNAKKTIRMQQKRAFDTGVSSNPSEWRRSGHGPVIGLKDPVVDLSGSKHTSLQSMQVLHSRGVGVLAKGVLDVHIHDINSSLHTRQGIEVRKTIFCAVLSES
jgi:hypothetical protein